VVGKVPTTTSVFGTSIHPDLAKLQCSQGLYSFRQAQSNLDKLTVHPVNNHTNVKLLSNQVGAVLAQENLKPETVVKADSSAEEVVIQIDGGISPLRIKTNAALKHYRLLLIVQKTSAPLTSIER